MQCSTTARWFEGGCPFSGTATGIYKTHISYIIWAGLPSKGIKLLADGMDSQTKCSSSREEYAAPSSVEPTKSFYHPFTSGLMKNFVKAMDRTSPAFRYLHETFPRLSNAKSKERIFVDIQIHFLHSHMDFFSCISWGKFNFFQIVIKKPELIFQLEYHVRVQHIQIIRND